MRNDVYKINALVILKEHGGLALFLFIFYNFYYFTSQFNAILYFFLKFETENVLR